MNVLDNWLALLFDSINILIHYQLLINLAMARTQSLTNQSINQSKQSINEWLKLNKCLIVYDWVGNLIGLIAIDQLTN